MLESITSLRQVKPLAYVLATITAAFVFFLMTSSAFAAAAPVITSATTDDINHDGTVDTITINFSPNAQVADTGAGADGLGSITLSNGCTTVANGNYASAGEPALVLTVSGCTALSTSITPTVTYTSPGSCATNTAICNVDASAQLANGPTVAADNAAPILLGVTFSNSTGTQSAVAVNKINFAYSENISIVTGVNNSSSATLGDMTVAGTVANIGTFATGGTVSVVTGKNSVTGNNTSTIAVELADQSGGYLVSSTTAPSGVFTPAAGNANIQETAAAHKFVDTTNHPTAGSSASWDLVQPTVSSITLRDAVSVDGRIDLSGLVFNSSMRDANFTNANGTLGGAVGSFSTGATPNDATINFVLTSSTALAQNTAANAADFVYTAATTKITDLAGNLVDTTAVDGAIASGDVVETDGAGPVLLTISPVNGAVGVSKTAVVTITFSEVVASMTFSIVGQSTADYTKNTSAAAVTLTPIGAMAGGYHAITVLTAPDGALSPNTYAGVSASAASNIVNPFHFTVLTSATGTVVTPASYSMLVTAPNGGEALVGGTTKNITWSSSQTNSSAMNNVNISYTTDNGATYHAIATNEANDGTYSWTVPSIDAAQVMVKVSGTDLVTVLASDSSDSEFSISTTAVVAPTSGNTGVSPVTGLTEDISTVAFGNYIKSPSFDTVYYVDHASNGTTLIRRPFNDHQTFITYQTNFNNVITVTDATLPTLSLGVPMMPKPGVVLVKIQTVNKVYAIGTSGELRWVTSESLASSIYGSNWSNYVIDIPDTLYPYFTHGSDITTDENIDVSGMKTRSEVNM